MILTLTRDKFVLYGILGKLSDGSGFECETLEHAYQAPSAGTPVFLPKLASGTYKVVRHAPNRLHYETFMVLGVPPFLGAPVDGILIHRGNVNGDSEGCILVGLERGTGCIMESEKAFDKLKALLDGQDSFTLVVT